MLMCLRKLNIALVDPVKKQGKCSVCIWILNSSKEAVKKVKRSQRAKRKLKMMFFEEKMQEHRCR